MKFLRKINLEINKDLYNPIQVKQNDTARYLLFNLLDNGVPFSLENKTVRVYGLKPDGTKVFNNLTIINAARGLAELQLTTQMLVKPGCLKLELVIYEATDILSTTKFDIDVIASLRDDAAIESTNEFSALTLGLSKLDEWDKYFKETSGAIEEKYTERLNGINSSLEHKVNKEVGKGLSTNDYSNEEQIEVSKVKDKADIIYVNNKVATLSNGTPLFASSVSEMTDTTKNYVNITDGFIYTYNGSTFIKSTAQYQSQGIANSSIKIKSNSSELTDLIGYKNIECEWVIGQIQSGNINTNAKVRVTTNNLINLTDDITCMIGDTSLYKYYVFYYTKNGVYTGNYKEITETTIIPKNLNSSIRFSIGYIDDRIISSLEITDTIDLFNDYYTPKSLKAKIDELSNDLIPSYWKSHLESKIDIIKSLQLNSSWNGTSFAFITDVHWNDNAKNSPVLLNKIMNECNINYCFDGGDFCANPSGLTKVQQESEIKEYLLAFEKLNGRKLISLGNHDDNSINNLYAQTIIDKEMYNLIYRKNSLYNQIKKGKTGSYFYVDDEMVKVRYVTLNCIDIPYVQVEDGLKYKGMDTWAFRQEQLSWFANVALDVPNSEWSVVVCSHVPINQGLIINDHIFMNVLQAFNDKTQYQGESLPSVNDDFKLSVSVDYTNKGGNVICWISGHTHQDKFITLPENITYKVLCTINDSLNVQSGQATKTKGTATEQAFDIFTINKETRTVNITRIGAGVDRSFTY